MRSVCDKFGALLIMDEVMCGLGRTGTYHAWQHPDIGVAPDMQMIGKTLGGGYMPIAGVLIGKKVASAMVENNGLVITLAGPWPLSSALQGFHPWLDVRKSSGGMCRSVGRTADHPRRRAG